MTNNEIDAAYIGNTPVEKIYLGAEEIYPQPGPTPVDYLHMPLTIKALESGTFNVNVPDYEVQVSFDSGDTWDYLDMGTTTGITVSAGDELQFIGISQGFMSFDEIGFFSENTLAFDVFGNIESLEYGDAGQYDVSNDRAFAYCFSECTGLHSAENLILPATALTESCYYGMFSGCTSLTTTPELPATQLERECYNSMFRDCTSLTTAPVLSATTLADGCYYEMFAGCTSLTTAPELPATALTDSCYGSMFYDCTSLTTAPALPATTLARSCYDTMFTSCASLTTAPDLPATALTNYCYGYMFQGCTSLNYVKCLATNISATGCLNNWVNGVAASGTFVKNANMTNWPSGIHGIPSGWTVLNDDGTEPYEEISCSVDEEDW